MKDHHVLMLFGLAIKVIILIYRLHEKQERKERVHTYQDRLKRNPGFLANNADNYLRLIKAIAKGKAPPEVSQLDFPNHFQKIWNRNCYAGQKGAFYKLVVRILDLNQCSLLRSPLMLEALYRVARYNQDFVRSPEELKLGNQGLDVQFNTVLIHCFANYPVPLFLDSAFFHEELAHQRQWYIDIGQGKNIRQSEGLPIKMTKKMAHFFLEAPENQSVNYALRWAQVRGHGGSSWLAERIAEGWLGHNRFADEEFWDGVILFLARQESDITARELLHILAYVGQLRQLRPDFSMRGRTLTRLSEQAQTWWEKCGRNLEGGGRWWPGMALGGYQVQDSNLETWVIVELTTEIELSAEGSTLNHCVGSYAHDCEQGHAAIFSLRKQVEDQVFKPIATIEVDPENRAVTEARANCNQPVKGKALSHIENWARQESLSLELEYA